MTFLGAEAMEIQNLLILSRPEEFLYLINAQLDTSWSSSIEAGVLYVGISYH